MQEQKIPKGIDSIEDLTIDMELIDLDMNVSGLNLDLDLADLDFSLPNDLIID